MTIDNRLEKIKQDRPPGIQAIKQASTDQETTFNTVTKSLRQDIRERKRYARRVYRFYKYWMYVLVGIILVGGLGWSNTEGLSFDIPEKVLLMLTGTTTLGVLGSFFAILRYLFSTKNKSH